MQNDLLGKLKHCDITYEMWLAIKQRFSVISLTRLQGLTMKFDSYKKKHNHTIKQHSRIIQV